MAKAIDRRAPPRMPPGLSREALDLNDGADVTAVALVGDASGVNVEDVEVSECTFEGVRLTAAAFTRSRFVDCVLADCDLSGVVLEQCVMTRVELRSCRLSGLQAAGTRFNDVGFLDCRLDGSNLRMTTWERAELVRCDMTESDLYGQHCRAAGCSTAI